MFKTTNAIIRNEPPSETAARDEFQKTSAETLRIPMSDYKANNFFGFQKNRVAALNALIEEKMKSLSK